MKTANPLKRPPPAGTAQALADPPQSNAPQGCTNFKLRQLLRSVARLYDTEIAQAGLKGSQFSLLSHVLTLGPISPSDLAAGMGMDASTLTRNLRPLIDKGWVLQGPGANHRGRSITITPAGQAKHAEARTHWKRAQLLLNQRLGESEVAALHRLMAHAQSALNEVDGPADGTADTGTEPAEA